MFSPNMEVGRFSLLRKKSGDLPPNQEARKPFTFGLVSQTFLRGLDVYNKKIISYFVHLRWPRTPLEPIVLVLLRSLVIYIFSYACESWTINKHLEKGIWKEDCCRSVTPCIRPTWLYTPEFNSVQECYTMHTSNVAIHTRVQQRAGVLHHAYVQRGYTHQSSTARRSVTPCIRPTWLYTPEFNSVQECYTMHTSNVAIHTRVQQHAGVLHHAYVQRGYTHQSSTACRSVTPCIRPTWLYTPEFNSVQECYTMHTSNVAIHTRVQQRAGVLHHAYVQRGYTHQSSTACRSVTPCIRPTWLYTPEFNSVQECYTMHTSNVAIHTRVQQRAGVLHHAYVQRGYTHQSSTACRSVTPCIRPTWLYTPEFNSVQECYTMHTSNVAIHTRVQQLINWREDWCRSVTPCIRPTWLYTPEFNSSSIGEKTGAGVLHHAYVQRGYTHQSSTACRSVTPCIRPTWLYTPEFNSVQECYTMHTSNVAIHTRVQQRAGVLHHAYVQRGYTHQSSTACRSVTPCIRPTWLYIRR